MKEKLLSYESTAILYSKFNILNLEEIVDLNLIKPNVELLIDTIDDFPKHVIIFIRITFTKKESIFEILTANLFTLSNNYVDDLDKEIFKESFTYLKPKLIELINKLSTIHNLKEFKKLNVKFSDINLTKKEILPNKATK